MARMVKAKLGRPKTTDFDEQISVRLRGKELKKLRERFNEFCSKNGVYDAKGGRRSFNEWCREQLGL